VQPFWSPDSQRVLFLDRPSPSEPAGIWSVGLEGGAPVLFTDRLGLYSGDMQWLAFPQNGETVVERIADGQRWTIPSGGRAVSFSPDNQFVAWTAGQTGPPFDTAQRQIWVSQVDGSQARAILSIHGGGFSGWLPDGRLLVSGRLDPGEEQQGFWSYSLEDGEMIELARAMRFRGASVSPGGTWLAYQITFGTKTNGGEQAANGLWLVNTGTGEKIRLDLFGAYRWQDDRRLLVIPLDITAPNHRIYQVDASTGAALPITDPEITPFKVANGDWTVSPDGRTIAFVSAEDYNIWILSIPAN
jgi:Tol biopolymer transport system component